MSEGGILSRLELSIYRVMMEIASEVFRDILEELDLKLLQKRDRSRYKNCGLRKRNLKTVFGVIEFKRRNYYDKKNSKYKFLLDDVVERSAVGSFSENLVELILRLVSNLSFRETEEQIERLTNIRLTHQSIWNIVQTVGKDILKYYESLSEEEHQETISTSILYEEHDGVYIKGQKRKGIEVKVGTFYTGWKREKENRYQLKNKIVFASTQNASDFLNIKEKLAYKTYDMDNVKLRVLNADGANWTSNVMDSRTIIQLDYFHIKQAIMTGIIDKKVISRSFKLLEKKDYDKLIEGIKEYSEKSEGLEKEKAERVFSYLHNNRKFIPRYKDLLPTSFVKMKESEEFRNMGIQENQNHMIIAKRMKHKRMSWSKQGATNIALVICDYINRKTWEKQNSKKNKLCSKSEEVLSRYIDNKIQIKNKIIRAIEKMK